MYLDGKALLHVIDQDTLSMAAAYLREGETVDAVWQVYMRIWVCAYDGDAENTNADQGPPFTAETWRSLPHAGGSRESE